ncbi:hypothetical protein GGI05_004948, partial [Coemansia sp. RSA 2603]
MEGTTARSATQRLMLSCDTCRRKKTRCTGDQPCSSCAKASLACHYSPVGPRKKPRRTAETRPRGNKRQASDDESQASQASPAADTGVSSVSHLMLEQVRQSEAL